MKPINFLFATFAVVAFTIYGCEQRKNPAAPETANLSELDAMLKSANTSAALTSAKKHTGMNADDLLDNKIAGTTINVPHDYPTIQAAVDAANHGDRIVVSHAGSPYNEDVAVNKDGIDIIASGFVTLNGGFKVSANHVSIAGFHIKPIIIPNVLSAGVEIFDASHVRVRKNTITGGTDGIFVGKNSTACVIEHNRVDNNAVFATTGISVNQASGNLIRNNHVRSNDFGIALNLSSGNAFIGNRSENNLRHGIAVAQSSNDNVFSRNISNNNGMQGIQISSSTNNRFGPNNTANFNAQHGIFFLSNATNNLVIKNDFHCNGSNDIRDDSGSNTFIDNSTGLLPVCQ